VTDEGDTILISANAGARRRIAGELCNKNFLLGPSWQNDQTPMAMGGVPQHQGRQKAST